MENKLSILVVGSGGREFAVAKKFKESLLVEEVYCAPGNGQYDPMPPVFGP